MYPWFRTQKGNLRNEEKERFANSSNLALYKKVQFVKTSVSKSAVSMTTTKHKNEK